MISEQDKKEIFNGAYGVTRNGKKAKFIKNIGGDNNGR